MGEYKITRCTTLEDCQVLLAAIHQIAALHWQSQNYAVEDTIEGKILIGKNAATNEDAFNAQATIKWADPVEAPDGSGWYFESLSNHPQFSQWQQHLATIEYNGIYEDIIKPIEWESLENNEEI